MLILKTKKAIKGVPLGGRLEVLTIDQESSEDMDAFCQATGNELLESIESDGVCRFFIKHTA